MTAAPQLKRLFPRESLTLSAPATPAGDSPAAPTAAPSSGGVSDNCTTGCRCRSRPDGVSLTVDQRSSSSGVNSAGASRAAASGTSPRSTIHLPTCASEMRTSQLPPSRARRASATIAPNAIR